MWIAKKQENKNTLGVFGTVRMYTLGEVYKLIFLRGKFTEVL
jgi:hypothetical protein